MKLSNIKAKSNIFNQNQLNAINKIIQTISERSATWIKSKQSLMFRLVKENNDLNQKKRQVSQTRLDSDWIS